MYESNCLANKMSGINYNIMSTQILIASLVGREIATSVGNETPNSATECCVLIMPNFARSYVLLVAGEMSFFFVRFIHSLHLNCELSTVFSFPLSAEFPLLNIFFFRLTK